MYGEKFIEELKNRIVLSDVIGRRIKVINKGKIKQALCPFHNEKTPSFNIDDQKGYYHCFGCNESGDVISFLQKLDGYSFKEAVEKLAEDYNISLPKIDKSQKTIELESEYSILYKINDSACVFFEKNLQINRLALEYLLKRGLKLENIKFFRLGFAINNYSALITYLKSLGFKEQQIEKAGLIVKGENGYYDKFKNRIMFPVLDKKGRVIAFTGRVLDDGLPKYMNSPETLLYHKSEVLFNYFFARKSMYDNNSAYLVEGNVDAISMFVNGIENTVAPMGTATTIQQIQELWNVCDNILLCFDGDNAGQKAMERVSNLILPILQPKKAMRIIFLPSDQDPDSYVKNFGKTAFMAYSKENSCTLSEFLFKLELKKLNIVPNQNSLPPENHNILELALKEVIEKIKDPLVAKNFRQFFNNQLWNLFKFKITKKSLNYTDITKINYKIKTPLKRTMDDLNYQLIESEKTVFALLLNFPELIDDLFQTYNIDVFNLNFSIELHNKIIAIFLDNYEQNQNDEKKLFELLEKNNFIHYINSKFIIKIKNKERSLIHLYIVLLERDEILCIKEIKSRIARQDKSEIIRELENELVKLITKKSKCKLLYGDL